LFARCGFCQGNRVFGTATICPLCDGAGCLPVTSDQLFDFIDACVLTDTIFRELHRLGVARRENLDDHHQLIATAIASAIGCSLDVMRRLEISLPSFSDFRGPDDRPREKSKGRGL
jgi:hypothetical protein